MRLVVVTRRTNAKVCILGELHHYRSHHLIVLMPQDMAVVNIPWELSQLIIRHVEVRTFLCIISCEFRFGPSDPIMKGLEWLHKGSVFPTRIIRLA